MARPPDDRRESSGERQRLWEDAGAMHDLLEGAKPLFVIGVPRSGTTMLARLLNSHPEIVQTYETAAFLLLDSIVKNTKRGFEAGILYGKEYSALWSDRLARSARGIIEDFYSDVLVEEGRTRLRYWGDKHPHHNACLPFIERLYPNAHYIYLVRDPRDVACSIAEMNACEFAEAMDVWERMSRSYEAFGDAGAPKRLHLVRYEDIVMAYEETLETIFAWLDVEFSDEHRQAISELKATDFHKPQHLATKKFSDESMGRWRSQLSGHDHEHALSKAGGYMQKYEYTHNE